MKFTTHFPFISFVSTVDLYISGLGFMVWLVSELPSPDDFVYFCKYYDIKWISIKALNHEWEYPNNFAPEDHEWNIIDYYEALQEADIECGFWQYTEGNNPAAEGVAVGDMMRKLESLLPKPVRFVQYDAEMGHWNEPNSSTLMTTYLNNVDMPSYGQGYLCTYRFPENFPAYPWNTALAHDNMHGNTPQVYWELAHNVLSQLEESDRQYKKLPPQPYMPIAPTYIRGTYGNPDSWWPTEDDLSTFVAACKVKGFVSWGAFRIGKVLQHYDTIGWQWMRGLTGKPKIGEIPPEPPSSLPEFVVSTVPRLNIRRSIWGMKVGVLINHMAVHPIKEKEDSRGRNWYKLHPGTNGQERWIAAWLTKEV